MHNAADPPATLAGVIAVRSTRNSTMESAHQQLTPDQLQEQLQAALREQERLRRDMHHRIRNNLQVIASLLDLQAEIAQHPQVDAVFANTQQRLQALARIHDSLVQTDEQVNAAVYLEELCKRLCEPYG